MQLHVHILISTKLCLVTAERHRKGQAILKKVKKYVG